MRVTSIVSPTERIHLVTREHGVVLLRPFCRTTLAVTLFGGGALELARSPAPSLLRWLAAILAGVIVSISLLGLVRRVMRWNRRRLVVTDRRALMLSGTFSRRATAISLDALHDLQIHISGTGRVLRYGSVIVTSGGHRGPLLGLRRIPHPDLLFALLLGLEQPRPASQRSMLAARRDRAIV
jgi:Bacterial PH domain